MRGGGDMLINPIHLYIYLDGKCILLYCENSLHILGKNLVRLYLQNCQIAKLHFDNVGLEECLGFGYCFF